jgi:hypothetical protein
VDDAVIPVAEVVLDRVRPGRENAREIDVESGEVLFSQPEDAVLYSEILSGYCVDILVLVFVLYFDADATALREPRLWKLNENIGTPVTQLLF